MRTLWLAALVLVSWHATGAEPVAERRPLLVTVDDLPLTGAAPESAAERRRVTEAHLAALKAHEIHAVGLVAWGNVHGSEDVELLRLWLAAGHELGNHTDRHLDYNAADVETYRTDAESARQRLQELVEPLGHGVRFFRFPMLHEGDTPEKLDAMRSYLAQSGQRNLIVTIDDDDWSFDRPWVEAGRAGERERQEQIAADYHANLRDAVSASERLGDELLGRRTPQVLLLHANTIGAAQWPRLFAGLAETHRFASADEVLAEPAFGDLPRSLARRGYGLWDRLAQERAEREARDGVTALLAAQAQAWTAGDLVSFCSVYAEDALFLSSSGQTRGRQAVLERYQKRYPDRAAMGALTLEVVELRPLASVDDVPSGTSVSARVPAVSVAARWTLRRAKKAPTSGLTLLVLRRDGARWRIVQDASF